MMARMQNNQYAHGFVLCPSLKAYIFIDIFYATPSSIHLGPREDWEEYREEYDEFLRQKREPRL